MKKLVVIAAAVLLFSGVGYANDLNIKAGFDAFGNLETKAKGGYTSNDIIRTGFSLAGEYLIPLMSVVKIGGGLEYQFMRTGKKYDNAKIGYVPVYATIQINPINSCDGIYFKGNVGYSAIFRFDPRNRNETTGGLYYGLGTGYDFKSGLILEMMYGMYTGTVNYRNAGGEADFNYSKLGFNIGYKFKV